MLELLPWFILVLHTPVAHHLFGLFNAARLGRGVETATVGKSGGTTQQRFFVDLNVLKTPFLGMKDDDRKKRVAPTLTGKEPSSKIVAIIDVEPNNLVVCFNS